jgi:hypothetical protein
MHGTVGMFDPALEEWSEYSERLAHYFVANDIVSDVRFFSPSWDLPRTVY